MTPPEEESPPRSFKYLRVNQANSMKSSLQKAALTPPLRDDSSLDEVPLFKIPKSLYFSTIHPCDFLLVFVQSSDEIRAKPPS